MSAPIYYLQTHVTNISQLQKFMDLYEFKSEIQLISDDLILRHFPQTGRVITYLNLEAFVLGELFYQIPKNFHYYPIPNPNNDIHNLQISPYSIIQNNPITAPLCRNFRWNNYLTLINNYGTFIRFSENKLQRLYWNLPLNAGLPLTEKTKCPVAEMIFFLHDLGHFLLPDLIFTGHLTDSYAQQIYVNWRLLGESITVVINEMLIVNYLKDLPEFHKQLKSGYDKPYRLYQALAPCDLKTLFWASYQYFCYQDSSYFLLLINSDHPDWIAFDQRYRSVALRGREWTESNFESLKINAKDYQTWWELAQPLKSTLNWQTIEDYYIDTTSTSNLTTNLFESVWTVILQPLIESTHLLTARPEAERQCLAFQRLMIGNLLLLSKYQCLQTSETVHKVINLKPNQSQIQTEIQSQYQTQVKILYDDDQLDVNEYHTYKNIYLMINPNMLKKDKY